MAKDIPANEKKDNADQIFQVGKAKKKKKGEEKSEKK